MEHTVFNYKRYRRDCWLGALGAPLMLAGDLCLSVIPAYAGDGGGFAREAYLTDGFQPWRLPLLATNVFCVVPGLRQRGAVPLDGGKCCRRMKKTEDK